MSSYLSLAVRRSRGGRWTVHSFAFVRIALLATLIGSQATLAASAPQAIVAEALARNGERVAYEGGMKSTSQLVRIRWRMGDLSPNGLSGIIELVEITQSNDPVPRQRSQEIQTGQLLLAVLDRDHVVRYWRIIADPNSTSSETADATGQLEKQSAHRSTPKEGALLEIAIPAAVKISELRILAPTWDSVGHLKLSQLGRLSIPARPVQ